MMDAEPAINVANELLALEQCRLPGRLIESTVFISEMSVDEGALIQRLAAQSLENCASLVGLIERLGGAPAPRSGDLCSADLHFQALHIVMPRLLDDQKNVVARYRRAVELVASFPTAITLISEILGRHQRDLEIIQDLTTADVSPTGDAG